MAIGNIDALVLHLVQHVSSSQKSERWAMYRLIMPIIDFANESLNFHPYFEYNQTSAHGTSQSVDIALLDGVEPRVMVEAKRANRKISAEQITKYLEPGVRGIVTNGVDWVLCLNGRNKVVSIHRGQSVAIDAVQEVVNFVRGGELRDSGWLESQQYVVPTLKPEKLAKPTTARRVSNPITVVTNCAEMRAEIVRLSTASYLDRVLLNAIAEQFETEVQFPTHLRCEVRSRRVAFFDEHSTSPSKRVARIELGRQQPDIIVLTALAESRPGILSIAPAAPHDKGLHMRRFRLDQEAQARQFGVELAKVLSIRSSLT